MADKGSRLNYLQGLKNAQMQQRSQNLTLDKVRETFEKTELTADADVKKQGVSAFFKTKASTVTEDKTGE